MAYTVATTSAAPPSPVRRSVAAREVRPSLSASWICSRSFTLTESAMVPEAGYSRTVSGGNFAAFDEPQDLCGFPARLEYLAGGLAAEHDATARKVVSDL